MENDKKYEKIKVEKRIFYDRKNTPFKWCDIKHLDLEDDDIFTIGWVEPYYSENESWDGHYNAHIIRMSEETDEEFEKRVETIERSQKLAKERRYETYLRLKKEFDCEE